MAGCEVAFFWENIFLMVPSFYSFSLLAFCRPFKKIKPMESSEVAFFGKDIFRTIYRQCA